MSLLLKFILTADAYGKVTCTFARQLVGGAPGPSVPSNRSKLLMKDK